MRKLLVSLFLLINIIQANTKSNIYKDFIYQGDLKSNTVLIYVQGGPSLYLAIDEFSYDIIASSPNKKIQNILIVYVHQYQTKHQKIFQKREITFQDAKEFDTKTTNMLKNTIDYFKAQDKKVYLLGLSFGGFVVQDYLATYGSKNIDGAVIGVSRLLMPKPFWKAFSKGKEYYLKDGVKLISINTTMGSKKDFSYKNLPKLAGGLGYKRYTKLLKDIDLSNIVYIYGQKDENVGRLSSKELEFLKNKGVKIAKSKGGHQKAIEEFVLPALSKIITGE